MPRRFSSGLALTALAWALALPLAASAVAGGGAPWRQWGLTIYAIGQAICHQRPERSFAWDGIPWPVCARCTGIYMGAAVGGCLALWGSVTKPIPAAAARRWLIVAALPAAMTAAYEWTAGQPPANLTRWASGLVVGGVTAALIVRLVREPAAARRRRAEVN